MSYNKLHKEIETLIQSRLETIFSQVTLGEDDLESILHLNKQLSNQSSIRKVNANISGYNLFTKELFPTVKSENEDMTTPDIIKVIANIWKNETDQQIKDDYNRRAKNIKPLTKENKKKSINKISNDSKIKKKYIEMK